MLSHLEEYVISSPIYRFVLVEKINKNLNQFLNSINSHGWNDVIYLDNNIVIVDKNVEGKIIFVAHTIFGKDKDLNTPFVYFSTSKENENDFNYLDNFFISIIIDIEYKQNSKNFKIPKFINYYTNIIYMFYNSIECFKIIVKEYNNEKSYFDEIYEKFRFLKDNLDSQHREFLNSLDT